MGWPRQIMLAEIPIADALHALSRGGLMHARLRSACPVDRDMIALYESDFSLTYGR